jgi:putative transcriptional regulator
MKKFSSLTNHFLIAMPSLGDPNFLQSVTYICEHNEDGAVGIIINRPLGMQLQHIFEQMSIESVIDEVNQKPILYGGPLQQDRGFVLHRPTGNWRSSLGTESEITVTTSQDILQAMARGEGPAETLIALGCAGWAPNQLEAEYQENAWLSCKADPAILFNTPYGERWEAAAKLLGVDLRLLSSDTGHA